MKSSESGGVSSLTLAIHSIRNITSPEDKDEGRQIFAGQIPLNQILKIPTNENVRGYLVEAEGKQRRASTQVHRAIRETLKEYPSRFAVLNGGIAIVASKSELNEAKRSIKLTCPSIINGSQTQGVVRDFVVAGNNVDNIHVKFELIICEDEDLIADISIARNFQNDVQLISIAGKKGELNELEEAVQKAFPDLRLQKSETQRPSADNEYVHTEKLLQVIAALLPPSLWWKVGEYNKTYTYSAKATCLKDFRIIYDGAKDEGSENFVEVYKFYLDVAPQAYELYLKWKEHQGFQGSGLRSIERAGKEIVDVPDGIVFPILASLAQFAVKTKGKWKISQPDALDDGELVKTAKRAYMEIGKSKPEIMGKSRGCYTALDQITAIYKKLLNKS
jgi:AIPR protein